MKMNKNLSIQVTLNYIPEGYRPANMEEVGRREHPAYFTRMVKVSGAQVQPMTGWAIKSYVGS